MDTLGIAALATEMATVRTQQAAQIALLKLANNAQANGALQLLQALPPNNPPHLGNRIDVFA